MAKYCDSCGIKIYDDICPDCQEEEYKELLPIFIPYNNYVKIASEEEDALLKLLREAILIEDDE
jgi:hypothetical protein